MDLESVKTKREKLIEQFNTLQDKRGELSKQFVNNIIYDMYKRGLSLIIDKKFVKNELEGELSNTILNLFYWFEEDVNLDKVIETKLKKDYFVDHYLTFRYIKLTNFKTASTL